VQVKEEGRQQAQPLVPEAALELVQVWKEPSWIFCYG
jgi:hypothetical protein